MSLKRKINKSKKYSFLSVDDLEKMKKRGLELSEELKEMDFMKNPKEFSKKSNELYEIISDLKLYEKYAKD